MKVPCVGIGMGRSILIVGLRVFAGLALDALEVLLPRLLTMLSVLCHITVAWSDTHLGGHGSLSPGCLLLLLGGDTVGNQIIDAVVLGPLGILDKGVLVLNLLGMLELEFSCQVGL